MLEVMTFSLVADAQADPARFLAADARMQVAAYAQPGLVRRTTARGDDGRWAVVTLWASAAAADAALAALADDPAAQAFEAFVAPGSRHRERFTPLP